MKIVWEDGVKPEEQNEHAGDLNPEVRNEADMTRKERRQYEKEKLKGMGFRKKLEYIWEYYKLHMALVLILIACFFVGYDIYQHAKIETRLNISVVNGGNYDYEAVKQEVKDILGTNGKYDDVSIGGNFITEPGGAEFHYNSQMLFVTQLGTASLDVMIMPEPLYETLNADGMFMNLKDVLGEELYASFGDQINETRIIFRDCEELIKKFDLFYDPLCVAVIQNSQHLEAAAKWIDSLPRQQEAE